jgi:hypothetical protein
VEVVDLGSVSGVGEKMTRSLAGGFTGVLREHVVGARLLDPALAMVVRDLGLVVERAAHGAFEDVGIDEGLTMSVRCQRTLGGKSTTAEVNVLPARSGRNFHVDHVGVDGYATDGERVSR